MKTEAMDDARAMDPDPVMELEPAAHVEGPRHSYGLRHVGSGLYVVVKVTPEGEERLGMPKNKAHAACAAMDFIEGDPWK